MERNDTNFLWEDSIRALLDSVLFNFYPQFGRCRKCLFLIFCNDTKLGEMLNTIRYFKMKTHLDIQNSSAINTKTYSQDLKVIQNRIKEAKVL